jgi:hypothetical protein
VAEHLPSKCKALSSNPHTAPSPKWGGEVSGGEIEKWATNNPRKMRAELYRKKYKWSLNIWQHDQLTLQKNTNTVLRYYLHLSSWQESKHLTTPAVDMAEKQIATLLLRGQCGAPPGWGELVDSVKVTNVSPFWPFSVPVEWPTYIRSNAHGRWHSAGTSVNSMLEMTSKSFFKEWY